MTSASFTFDDGHFCHRYVALLLPTLRRLLAESEQVRDDGLLMTSARFTYDLGEVYL